MLDLREDLWARILDYLTNIVPDPTGLTRRKERWIEPVTLLIRIILSPIIVALTFVLTFIPLITSAVLLEFIYWNLSRVSDFNSRSLGTVDLSQCPLRVSDDQSSLFSRYHYKQMFSAPHNRVLLNQRQCQSGFQGNADLYGLGIRLGVYMQWVACVIANQILGDHGWVLRQACFIFSVAICITIVILTFQQACIFSLEIVILHIMFYGGDKISRRPPPRTWNALRSRRVTWLGFFTVVSRLLTLLHAVWFYTYGYSSHFVVMPCDYIASRRVPRLHPGFLASLALLDFLPTLLGFGISVTFFNKSLKYLVLGLPLVRRCRSRHGSMSSALHEEMDDDILDSPIELWKKISAARSTFSAGTRGYEGRIGIERDYRLQ